MEIKSILLSYASLIFFILDTQICIPYHWLNQSLFVIKNKILQQVDGHSLNIYISSFKKMFWNVLYAVPPSAMLLWGNMSWLGTGAEWCHAMIQSHEYTHENTYNTEMTKLESLQWHHYEHDGISNHRRLHCLLSHLFRHRSASLAFVRGIHQWLVDSLHKRPVTWKMVRFDDVMMI